MMSPLGVAFFVSLILAIILAVARDVPILHLAAYPKGLNGLGLVLYVGSWLACMALFAIGKAAPDDRIMTASGILSMATLWCLAGWNLWMRR